MHTPLAKNDGGISAAGATIELRHTATFLQRTRDCSFFVIASASVMVLLITRAQTSAMADWVWIILVENESV